jgi:chemotaxis protein methyltransferase CheR
MNAYSQTPLTAAQQAILFQATQPLKPLPSTTAGTTGSKSNLDAESFQLLRTLIEDMCGIAMGDEKRYLIESRLAKLITEAGCETYRDFYMLAKQGTQTQLKLKIVDAMTTKETLWFRDDHPFETLKTHLLPELEKRGGPIRIWSAACSTGQEPYTIGMCVQEYASEHSAAYGVGKHPFILPGGCKIKGTDIAPTSIMLSKLGRYDQVAMSRGLSELRKNRFFEIQGKVWAVKPDVKQMCEFQPYNLQDDFTILGKYDLIFIRNVAIYFAKDFKKQLFERLSRQLNPGGAVIIGSTESLLGVTEALKPETIGRTIVYRKVGT